MIVIYTPLEVLIADLADLIGARTMFRSPDGRIANADSPWSRKLAAKAGDLVAETAPAGRVATRQTEGRDIQIAMLPLTSPFGTDLGAIAALRDVSTTIQQRELISRLSYFALACTLVLFLAFVNWYLRSSFRPLNAVIRSLNALSAGRTDISVNVPETADEIGRLAGTFESFRQGMQARTQLERLQQELEVAARIQRQCLPSRFPDHPRIKIAATMQAARDVGGDFYDVFDLPDGRIGCVIADVSDKGIGAALFMVASRTVLRSTAALTTDPADCLSRANDYLAADNEAMMFVTAFYAIIDPESGTVAYANAGHNPPVHIDAAGACTFVTGTTEPALGIIDGFPYTTESLTLAPGASLFLYTDGVTEAMAVDGEEYDDDRLHAALQATPEVSANDRITRVMADVDAFTEGVAQSDDITCLALGYARHARTSEASS